MQAVMFDLDGTLCDIRHRLHHVAYGGRDWDAFFAGIPDDDVCEPVREILQAMLDRGNAIILCSGRPEKCRLDTEAWLDRNFIPYTQLYMRPDNDSRPDHVVKLQLLDGIIADGYEPQFVVDDRPSVVEAWRERGLFCLQCAPSESAQMPDTALLTIMIGPSGAGKSTWLESRLARDEFGIRPSQIISSDQIRADLCGDFRDQSKNAAVFAAVHRIVKARLASGLPTVIDATHIRRRDRVAAAMLSNGACPVRYIIIDQPLEQKYKRGGWRNEVMKDGKQFDLIRAHAQTFNSQIKEILRGDDLPNVTVHDMRRLSQQVAAA